jgi:hypothetical protein
LYRHIGGEHCVPKCDILPQPPCAVDFQRRQREAESVPAAEFVGGVHARERVRSFAGQARQIERRAVIAGNSHVVLAEPDAAALELDVDVASQRR